MQGPTIEISSLENADGSVNYSHSGYVILASVNGPLEVQRRDEISDEATVEVNVRPAAGTAALKERYLENKIHSVLRQVIKVEEFPRTLIQVTLQIIQEPTHPLTDSLSLFLIPPLLQASITALMSASLPSFVAPITIAAAIPWNGPVIVDPSPQVLDKISSIHVFSLTPSRDLLFSESAGSFTYLEWDTTLSTAEDICCEEVDDSSSMRTEALERSRETYSGLWRRVAADIVHVNRQWKQGKPEST